MKLMFRKRLENGNKNITKKSKITNKMGRNG